MEEVPRILGLDVGNRRIGVAVSDALGLTAQPVLTLERKNPRADLRSLARLARKYGRQRKSRNLRRHWPRWPRFRSICGTSGLQRLRRTVFCMRPDVIVLSTAV
jgi:hypothetical protein